MSIGEQIKKARNNKGMTQAALSEAVGVSRAHINTIELGKTKEPSCILVFKISKVLGVSLDSLFKGVSYE